MTVLVTGASGLIGGALARRLLADGRPVRLGGRSPERLRDRFGEALPLSRLPAHDAPDDAFDALVQGATAIVHCAALNSDASSASELDFRNANASLPARIAEAGLRAGAARFVHMSSIRAVAGAGVTARIGSDTEPRPACDYGRSKLEGEQRLIDAVAERPDHSLTILRPAPVYGYPLGGNLRLLARLADTALPLPFAGIAAPRSLLSLDALVDAIMLLLDDRPSAPSRTFIVSDRSHITFAEIIAAMREGFARPRRLFAAPPALLAGALSMIGKQKLWRNLVAGQVCDPSALETTGWAAPRDTAERLAALMRCQSRAA